MIVTENGPVIADHQPNFFSRLGSFENVLERDIFVFSDDLNYPKGTYVNRVQILVGGKPGYLTLPIRKG
jgi:hypothetical protein